MGIRFAEGNTKEMIREEKKTYKTLKENDGRWERKKSRTNSSCDLILFFGQSPQKSYKKRMVTAEMHVFFQWGTIKCKIEQDNMEANIRISTRKQISYLRLYSEEFLRLHPKISGVLINRNRTD